MSSLVMFLKSILDLIRMLEADTCIQHALFDPETSRVVRFKLEVSILTQKGTFFSENLQKNLQDHYVNLMWGILDLLKNSSYFCILTRMYLDSTE
jgi:hypothetical protein